MIDPAKRYAAIAVLALCATGCDRREGPRAIHETEIKPRMGGGGMPMDAVHGFGAGQAADAPAGAGAEVEFDTPEGWVFEPGTGMRLAAFKIKDAEGEREATIVALPSSEDGYSSNVRRWLGQLGITLPGERLEAFIAEREPFTAGGMPGALFDFTRLKDVPDGGKGSMLASMIDHGGTSIFVKLTGGPAFLRKQKANFLALSKSIRVGAGEASGAAGAPSGAELGGAMGGGAAGAAGKAGMPEAEGGMRGGMAGKPGGGMPGGMGGGMSMQSADPAFNRVPSGVSRLAWQTPHGWKTLEAKGMRTGSFSVPYEGKTADGSIVQLPGPAGGVENNVRRWMEQAGLPQLDDRAMRSFLSSQKRFKTRDGFEGILVNLAAQLNGDMVQENSILVALIQARDETIFVKLTGPRSVLLRNVDALEALASSLAVER